MWTLSAKKWIGFGSLLLTATPALAQVAPTAKANVETSFQAGPGLVVTPTSAGAGLQFKIEHKVAGKDSRANLKYSHVIVNDQTYSEADAIFGATDGLNPTVMLRSLNSPIAARTIDLGGGIYVVETPDGSRITLLGTLGSHADRNGLNRPGISSGVRVIAEKQMDGWKHQLGLQGAWMARMSYLNQSTDTMAHQMGLGAYGNLSYAIEKDFKVSGVNAKLGYEATLEGQNYNSLNNKGDINGNSSVAGTAKAFVGAVF